ncbi:unnamed protein product [Linum tenue]|uniref:Uncharacterized protein n=1 Tax=Linum tenue TaxID=586396 RepID=A0AAV0N2U5_9ROSI|nr:unnamed protein product [Linum tenue]
MDSLPPPPSATRLVEICRVTPPPEYSSTEISLPLTFFDTIWLKFHPVERIFFYRLSSSATSSPSEFHAAVVPRLKRSLSLALHRFLPLAGNLTWPADADVPLILYSPGDGVSLTIAESAADEFDPLAGDGPRDAILSRAYLPKLCVSKSNGAVLALQITLFPSKGFCIGVAAHHAVLDGKSTVMFLKAWAHISSKLGSCDDGDGSLTEELTPFLDRTVVKDPEGIALEDVQAWMCLCGGQKSLELWPEAVPTDSESNQVRATFKLSKQDILRLKQSVMLQLESNDSKLEIRPRNLSTFVVTSTYALVCMVKAKGLVLEEDKKALLIFSADCRSRLEPPLPSNYFGNCVMPFNADLTIGNLIDHEAGITYAAHKLVEVIRELEKGVLVGAKGRLARFFGEMEERKDEVVIGVGVAGSPRFGVYGVDFGYGRPEKVEITSIDGSSAMSMAESGDGSGGVEVGVVMRRHEMEKFTSFFTDGLKHI